MAFAVAQRPSLDPPTSHENQRTQHKKGRRAARGVLSNDVWRPGYWLTTTDVRPSPVGPDAWMTVTVMTFEPGVV